MSGGFRNVLASDNTSTTSSSTCKTYKQRLPARSHTLVVQTWKIAIQRHLINIIMTDVQLGNGGEYFDLITQYHDEYQRALTSHLILPFSVPSCMINTSILVVYLTLSTKRSLSSRLLVLGLLTAQSVVHAQQTRSLAIAYGCFIGVADCWCILLAIQFLFVYDARVLARPIAVRRGISEKRHPPAENGQGQKSGSQEPEILLEPIPPPGIIRRFFRVIDLLGSMRLFQWKKRLEREPAGGPPTSSFLSAHTPESLSASHCWTKLLAIYLLVDIMKTIVASDPYFWGFVDAEGPEHLPFWLRPSICTRAYRLLTAFIIIYLAIELIATIGHLVFIHLLGPRIVGTWANPALYRQHFGPPSSIYLRGLRGFWGTFWHQFFRGTFVGPVRKIAEYFDMSNVSGYTALMYLFVPFWLSGIVHACGSYTLWGHTRPLDAFMFFFWQPPAILVQLALTRTLSLSLPLLSRPRLQRAIMTGFNVVTTIGFLFLTFGLLADDYARGGLFLSEPFPVSVVSLLGFGGEQRPLILWFDYGVHWYRGRWPWQSGIAL